MELMVKGVSDLVNEDGTRIGKIDLIFQ